jgi:hypothetical protein
MTTNKIFLVLGALVLGLVLALPTFADTNTGNSGRFGGMGERFGFGGESRYQPTAEQQASREALRAEREAHRAAVEAALESGDYTAWQAATADRAGPMAELITADNFGKLVELHNARESGDYETAQKLATELGLPARGERGGFGRGGQRGDRAGQHPCEVAETPAQN